NASLAGKVSLRASSSRSSVACHFVPRTLVFAERVLPWPFEGLITRRLILTFMGAACCSGSSSDKGSRMPAAFGQEPCPFLGFVDPVLQQACGGHVPCLVTQRMRLAHGTRQGFVIVSVFGQHVERLDVVGVVVRDALRTRNLPDGADG